MHEAFAHMLHPAAIPSFLGPLEQSITIAYDFQTTKLWFLGQTKTKTKQNLKPTSLRGLRFWLVGFPDHYVVINPENLHMAMVSCNIQIGEWEAQGQGLWQAQSIKRNVYIQTRT